MNKVIKHFSLVAVGMAGYQSSVFPQSALDHRLNCQVFGTIATDALDPMQGHSLATNTFSCRIEGGPLDKGWATGQQIYEYNGPSGIGKAGIGVLRHPNGVAVWTNDQMKTDLKVQDGKVVGFRSTGSGRYTMGAGLAKEMQDKTFTYVGGPTGPGQFVVETKLSIPVYISPLLSVQISPPASLCG